MKYIEAIFRAAGCVLACTLFSCTAVDSRRPAEKTVALLLRLPDGKAPSQQHVMFAQNSMEAKLREVGLRLAPEPRAADFLLTVDVVPDDADPSMAAIRVVSLERRKPGQDDPLRNETHAALQEIQKHQQEYQRWVDAQNRPRRGDGDAL